MIHNAKAHKYAVAVIVLVSAALLFIGGWLSRQSSLGIYKSREAIFFHMEDGAIECALRPSFMTRLFGANWRDQAIYISYKGWTSSSSISIVESELAPMTSLCLDYTWRVPLPPKGRRWDVEVELYSRTSKKVIKLTIGMKSHELNIVNEAVLRNTREIVRPNGSLALRPLSGPGSEIP